MFIDSEIGFELFPTETLSFHKESKEKITPEGLDYIRKLIFSYNSLRPQRGRINIHSEIMAKTYSKIFLQIVFAVKNRIALLDKEWRNELFAYIAASLNQRGNYSLAFNGYNDHVHLFFNSKSKELIQDIVREIKKSSNLIINERFIQNGHFEWQNEYGVFSHGNREKGIIIDYITNQEEHHKQRKFKDEYLSLLEKFEIDFKNEYLFEFLE